MFLTSREDFTGVGSDKPDYHVPQRRLAAVREPDDSNESTLGYGKALDAKNLDTAIVLDAFLRSSTSSAKGASGAPRGYI